MVKSNDFNWDEKLEFLINARRDWCNNDYIEFLIDKVWKIDRSIDVIDFGCGYGYLCDLVMPLLPAGSTYTGIDKSEKLLKAARKHLSSYSFPIKLICEDLNKFKPKELYDVAISQAVLRHIPKPINILKTMKDSVRKDGLVICFEGDRPIEEAGFYSSDINCDNMSQYNLFQKKWNYELDNGGRDFRTGIKVPQFMQQIGLKDIGIRMNDSVKFINPMDRNYEDKFNSFIGYKGYLDTLNTDNKEEHNVIEGLTEEEQREFYNNQREIAESIINNKGKGFIVQAPCIFISYGRK